VHCLGALSGRQRRNFVPWRKRLELTWLEEALRPEEYPYSS
jgi:hypothetical protein